MIIGGLTIILAAVRVCQLAKGSRAPSYLAARYSDPPAGFQPQLASIEWSYALPWQLVKAGLYESPYSLV